MKLKRLIIILIIINIVFLGIICNFLKKDYFNNRRLILKTMSETEYEDSITSLNQSHENYAKFIQDSKTKIASAITDMGVETSNQATPDTIVNNIKNIARDASSISYDNISSGLTSTNVQNAVDELNTDLTPIDYSSKCTINSSIITNYADVKAIKIGKFVYIYLHGALSAYQSGNTYTACYLPDELIPYWNQNFICAMNSGGTAVPGSCLLTVDVSSKSVVFNPVQSTHNWLNATFIYYCP